MLIQLPLIFEIRSFEHGSSSLHKTQPFDPGVASRADLVDVLIGQGSQERMSYFDLDTSKWNSSHQRPSSSYRSTASTSMLSIISEV